MKKIFAEISKHFRLCLPVLLILGIGMLGVPAFGQGSSNIVGTVTDPSGAVVPNATVTVTNQSNGFVRSTTSTGAGTFLAAGLESGTYTVKIEARGFKTFQQNNVILNVATTVRENASLQIGNVGQSVTVQSNPLQVQADTSDVSETISGAQLANLGTNGRNVLQLATLVPGAASNMPDFDSAGAQFQSHAIQFNGMRSDANNWTIDGGEAYDRGGGGIMLVNPSQDALQEFTIQTSNYSADEGGSSGGMISMSIKSGTKQYHGSAWEYNRNDALDAYSYFTKQSTPVLPKAELRYNVFGFNIGGPLKFKRTSNPKTFFFYNMEWHRQIAGGSIHRQAPTAAEYGGAVGPLGKIWVPNTTDPAAIAKFANAGLVPGQEFPNDTVPASLIDPNAAAYIKAGYFLPANASGGYYVSTANQTTNVREEIARVDHQFSQKWTMFASFVMDSQSQISPTVAWTGNTFPTIGGLETIPSWQGVLHFTEIIRPNLLNEMSYDENGNQIVISDTGLYTAPSGWAPPPLFSGVNTANKIPGISIGGGKIGLSMDSGNWPWKNWWKSNEVKDSISWTHGAHSFKFGGAWYWSVKRQQLFVNKAGSYNFNGNATGCAVSSDTVAGACPSNTGGVGLADFLLGDANSFGQPELQDFVNIANNRAYAYALDNWRIKDRLTLNLGIRWEGLPQLYDTNNRASNFYPSLWNPADAAEFTTPTSGALNTAGPGFTTVSGVTLSKVLFYMNGIGLAGQNGTPRGLAPNNWKNFAPRVGFAYDVFGEQKTILRGGFGSYFETNAGNQSYNMGSDPPFSNSTSTNFLYLSAPTVSYQTGENAGASPTTPQGFTGIDPTLPVSTIYQFNLGLQQQVSRNSVFTVAFVGNTSFHLSQLTDINSLSQSDLVHRAGVCGSACGASHTLNANYYRSYVGWSDINEEYNQGNAQYEGLQATFRTRAWKNLTLSANYTWSHAWDVIDGQLFNNLPNSFDPGYSYGTAGFDRRNIAVVNFIYNVPIFQASHGFAQAVLGGWTFSGIVSMQSGNPGTVGAPNWLGLPGTSNRANLAGPVSYPHKVNEWFDPSAFALPAMQTAGPGLQVQEWGNAPKNNVVNPGEQHWNLSLYKDFKFSENTGFQLRADAFNAWNHATFGGANTGIFSGQGSGLTNNAGALTGTGDPREFQLGGRLYF